VSNAIEHGFPDGEQGTIAVTLKLAQGTGELTVRDDGFGLGSGSQGSGMGLQIVKTLATQVGGSLEKLDTTETEFRVCFITSLRK
jgi:two-component sensor histidine kinase